MADYVIGIDIGTGSTKALAVNFKGYVISIAQVHYPTFTPEPGHFEQAPELIWQALVKCVARIIAEVKINPAAVIMSSAMHSIMAVDQNGKPLHNVIIWADNRSADIAERIKQSAA